MCTNLTHLPLALACIVLSAPAFGKTESGPFEQVVAPLDPMEMARGDIARQEPPLWGNLGGLTYPVTTSNPSAQLFFDRGLKLAYAFNHTESRRAFRTAQGLDPACAMCFWGEALVLGPNINAPMQGEAVAPALAAIGTARSLSAKANSSEQALIAALAVRYSGEPDADRARLDLAYADAMSGVARTYPDDDEIAVLFAESLMDLSPWDYWQESGSKPKGKAQEIVSTLQRVLRRHPDHPGAIHLYIHIVEASTDPKRAEPYAERLAALMPDAGHLVHMPSHIYFRLGRYRDSLTTNRAAVEADERYLQQYPSNGIYLGGYYPHNMHFLMVSAQMGGDGLTAIEAANKLAGMIVQGTMNDAAWVQPIRAAPYFVHAQFSDEPTVMSVADPGDRLPYVKAMWHYMRGVASTWSGDSAAAEREAQAIVQLAESADFRDLEAGGVPARKVLTLAQHIVLARSAKSRGEFPSSIAHLETAASIEKELPYLEPPFWYHPVRQSLGAVRLMAGDLSGAEVAFRESLEQAPHNAWSLFGLCEVYRRQERKREADDTEQLFLRAWLGRQARPVLDRM